MRIILRHLPLPLLFRKPLTTNGKARWSCPNGGREDHGADLRSLSQWKRFQQGLCVQRAGGGLETEEQDPRGCLGPLLLQGLTPGGSRLCSGHEEVTASSTEQPAAMLGHSYTARSSEQLPVLCGWSSLHLEPLPLSRKMPLCMSEVGLPQTGPDTHTGFPAACGRLAPFFGPSPASPQD